MLISIMKVRLVGFYVIQVRDLYIGERVISDSVKLPVVNYTDILTFNILYLQAVNSGGSFIFIGHN